MNQNSACGGSKPLMGLGDGSNAPSLNYNLPQSTCYHGKGFFPITIEESYIKPEILKVPKESPWSIAANKDKDAIESILREDLLNGGGGKLILNAHLLKYHSYLIRLLKGAPASPITGDTKPQSDTGTDPNLRVALTDPPRKTSNDLQKRVNHLAVLPEYPSNRILVAGYTLSFMAEQVQNGLIPQLKKGFGGRVRMSFLAAPILQPRLTLIEHYKVCAYLGDYGAGKTVRTMTLLPGESTTISLKSFRDKTSSYSKSSSTNSNEYSSTYFEDDEVSTSVKAENILDSFSQYSADQLQSHIETIEGTSTGEQNGSYSTVDEGTGGGRGGGFNLLGLVNWQGGSSWQNSIGSGTSTNSIREDHLSTLNAALESTVTESGQYRDIEVNTTTANQTNNLQGGAAGSSSSISVSQQEQMVINSGESTSTLRHLHNINQSRTLNFVFRQMLQEYIVLTYLDDVTIVFSLGYPGQSQTVRLSQLRPFLNSILLQRSHLEEVYANILRHLCNVTNYQGQKTSFIERIEEQLDDCITGSPTLQADYLRKKADLKDTYSSGGLEISVPGVIVSTSSQILRTDSVIADAILGQGEALDCFNQQMQDQSITEATLENEQKKQALELEKKRTELALAVIAKITDPDKQVEAFKTIFGDCCHDDLSALIQTLGKGV